MKQRPESERQALIAELRALQQTGQYHERQALLVAELRTDWEHGWPPYLPYPALEVLYERWKRSLDRSCGCCEAGCEHTWVSRTAARTE